MIGKLFGKKKKEPTNTDKSLQTLQNLNGQIDVLKKKIYHCDKQIQGLTLEAKEKLKSGDKAGAKKALAKKKRLNDQIKQLEGAQNMMEEQKAMLESSSTMKDVFNTLQTTTKVIKESGQGVSVEEIEKVREEMEDIKDAQKEVNDMFSEYAEQGAEEVDDELAQMEKEMAEEEVSLPSANKEEIQKEPDQKVQAKVEEESLGDFLA